MKHDDAKMRAKFIEQLAQTAPERERPLLARNLDVLTTPELAARAKALAGKELAQSRRTLSLG